jgi:hypothetical protein
MSRLNLIDITERYYILDSSAFFKSIYTKIKRWIMLKSFKDLHITSNN